MRKIFLANSSYTRSILLPNCVYILLKLWSLPLHPSIYDYDGVYSTFLQMFLSVKQTYQEVWDVDLCHQQSRSYQFIENSWYLVSQCVVQSQISQIIFAEKKMSGGEILGNFGKFWEFLRIFGKFWEILPQFTHFHVEKNWAQKYTCGEKMTNMRSASGWQRVAARIVS